MLINLKTRPLRDGSFTRGTTLLQAPHKRLKKRINDQLLSRRLTVASRPRLIPTWFQPEPPGWFSAAPRTRLPPTPGSLNGSLPLTLPVHR